MIFDEEYTPPCSIVSPPLQKHFQKQTVIAKVRMLTTAAKLKCNKTLLDATFVQLSEKEQSLGSFLQNNSGVASLNEGGRHGQPQEFVAGHFQVCLCCTSPTEMKSNNCKQFQIQPTTNNRYWCNSRPAWVAFLRYRPNHNWLKTFWDLLLCQ